MTREQELKEYSVGLYRKIMAYAQPDPGVFHMWSSEAEREIEERATRDWDEEWARTGRAPVSPAELLAWLENERGGDSL